MTIPESARFNSRQQGSAFFTMPIPHRSACSESEVGEPCKRVNGFWFFRPNGTASIAFGTCECGKRYPNHDRCPLTRERVIKGVVSEGQNVADVGSTVDATLCPDDLATRWSKVGVVPVGTRVLHSPCMWVRLGDENAGALGDQMIKRMEVAHGVGLAANQVGVPLRVLVHKAKAFSTRVLVNPLIVERSSEVVEYGEGCLSLAMDGTHGLVVRNSRILVVAGTADGRFVCIDAGGFLAIVMQHEIDHLDGIEYVQRLTHPAKTRIYQTMRREGIDVDMVPHLGAAR